MGLLEGIRVVELASERGAFAGKLLADLGADVIVVEPPGGHVTRTYGPFLDDDPDAERSLWWWTYNTSKRGVTLDLDTQRDQLLRLIGTADIVLEGEPPGSLHGRGLDYVDVKDEHPALIWVSVTPFGRHGPRAGEASTDLTIQANAGPVWSCGYDDHTIPPVRPGGNQGYHTGAIWAAMGALTAYLARAADPERRGQLVDVNVHAANNVTTELATYEWLVRGATVQRQTARHALVERSSPAVTVGSDGGMVTTGVPPRTGREFKVVLDWIQELGFENDLEDLVFLEMAARIDSLSLALVGKNPEATAMYGAGRDAIMLIGSRLPAYDFFVEAQRRGLTAGIIYSPEEVVEDPHLNARGFIVDVEHERFGRMVRYLGVPLASTAIDRQIRRAPHVGEHDEEVWRSVRAAR